MTMLLDLYFDLEINTNLVRCSAWRMQCQCEQNSFLKWLPLGSLIIGPFSSNGLIWAWDYEQERNEKSQRTDIKNARSFDKVIKQLLFFRKIKNDTDFWEHFGTYKSHDLHRFSKWQPHVPPNILLPSARWTPLSTLLTAITTDYRAPLWEFLFCPWYLLHFRK